MPFLPQASSAAGRVDSVFLFILVLCVAFLVFITLALIYFVFKYSRKRHPRGKDIEGNLWLEIVWTAVPTVLFLVMFFFGWTNYNYMRQVPRDAMVIEVTARQWAWSFKYPNGRQTTDLLLAINRPVKLELRSLDVIHGFFVPAFRIKEDVVPGKQNYTWFAPTQLGSFDIQCTVICGVDHANMLAKAIVVPESEFETWYFGGDDAPLPGQAEAAAPAEEASIHPAMSILNQKGCLACHSIDGSPMVGPSLKGLYGGNKMVTAPDGREYEVTVDEVQLAKSIQEPDAENVDGYPPIMPNNPLTDSELQQVIDFIKTLK